MTGDEHEAQDIAQEAVVRAWRHRATVREVADPAGWLAAITRNEAYRVLSRRPATLPLDDDLPRPAPDRHGPAVTGLDVRRALRELEPLDRTIALLRYREDLTQPRIAQLLNMPEGTVKVRLHRLRLRLRDSLNSA
jgi:RNA polymerase sigma-70 factor, ECF subfamily